MPISIFTPASHTVPCTVNVKSILVEYMNKQKNKENNQSSCYSFNISFVIKTVNKIQTSSVCVAMSKTWPWALLLLNGKLHSPVWGVVEALPRMKYWRLKFCTLFIYLDHVVIPSQGEHLGKEGGAIGEGSLNLS